MLLGAAPIFARGSVRSVGCCQVFVFFGLVQQISMDVDVNHVKKICARELRG